MNTDKDTRYDTDTSGGDKARTLARARPNFFEIFQCNIEILPSIYKISGSATDGHREHWW
jgi:hypothetical protein